MYYRCLFQSPAQRNVASQHECPSFKKCVRMGLGAVLSGGKGGGGEGGGKEVGGTSKQNVALGTYRSKGSPKMR